MTRAKGDSSTRPSAGKTAHAFSVRSWVSKPCLAHRSPTSAKNLPEADIQTRCRSIILRSSAPELSNNIIQKGLAFIGDWSGTVVKSGRHERPGILPRRLVGRGGASVVRRNAVITEWRIPMPKSSKKRSPKSAAVRAATAKPAQPALTDPEKKNDAAQSKLASSRCFNRRPE